MLHILPEDGLGGAEIAARRAAEASPGGLTVAMLSGGSQGATLPNLLLLGGTHPLSPMAAWRAGMLARAYPVAVFSLWKSVLAMLACALLAPRTRRVLFLHSDRRVHWPDRIATWLGVWMADELWGDCRRSLDGAERLTHADRPARAISFMVGRLVPPVRGGPRSRFIYWGRLNPLKRLDRVVDLFALIAAGRPEATLTLVGPDAGSESALRTQVQALGLADKVTFTGAKTMAQIIALAADHDIFLQLSDQEGAAMSLIEAMQLGLVPVVTPVGEMGVYVRPMATGVLYETADAAAADIGRILDDPALFAKIGAAAVDHWAGRPLYQEDVLAAARDLARRED